MPVMGFVGVNFGELLVLLLLVGLPILLGRAGYTVATRKHRTAVAWGWTVGLLSVFGLWPGLVALLVLALLPAGEATKTCPRCAETIKAGAQVCRYCGHEFSAQR